MSWTLGVIIAIVIIVALIFVRRRNRKPGAR